MFGGRISKAMAPADMAAKEVTPFYQGPVAAFMAKRHLTRMPTISSVSTADSGSNLPVKNTFIDLDIGRPPSLEGFFNERLIRSAPGSQVEDQTEEPLKEADTPPVICLAAALSFTGQRTPKPLLLPRMGPERPKVSLGLSLIDPCSTLDQMQTPEG
eukprot:s120_g15.t1